MLITLFLWLTVELLLFSFLANFKVKFALCEVSLDMAPDSMMECKPEKNRWYFDNQSLSRLEKNRG